MVKHAERSQPVKRPFPQLAGKQDSNSWMEIIDCFVAGARRARQGDPAFLGLINLFGVESRGKTSRLAIAATIARRI
jgi:hypothetical protein